mgnify:CR=1 FL=1
MQHFGAWGTTAAWADYLDKLHANGADTTRQRNSPALGGRSKAVRLTTRRLSNLVDDRCRAAGDTFRPVAKVDPTGCPYRCLTFDDRVLDRLLENRRIAGPAAAEARILQRYDAALSARWRCPDKRRSAGITASPTSQSQATAGSGTGSALRLTLTLSMTGP